MFGQIIKKVIDVYVNLKTGKELKRVEKTITHFKKSIRETTKTYNSMGKQVGMTHIRQKKFAQTTKGAVPYLSRFRMEMLGIMFFGQGMQKTFTGLLQPAMDMVGVFDLMNQTLGILFLPTALWILDNIMLPMMDWFTNMSPTMQGVIGGFTVFGAVLGFILASVGGLVLAASSLVIALISLGVPAAAIGAAFGAIGAVLATIGIALGVAILLWQTDLGGFRDFVKTIFDSIGKFAEIVFGDIKDIFSGLSEILDGNSDGFQKVFDALVDIAAKAFVLIATMGANTTTFLGNLFMDILEGLMKNFLDINAKTYEKLASWLPEGAAKDRLLAAAAGSRGFASQISLPKADYKSFKDIAGSLADATGIDAFRMKASPENQKSIDQTKQYYTSSAMPDPFNVKLFLITNNKDVELMSKMEG